MYLFHSIFVQIDSVNLLREGIDLPQVSLVAVMNTDAEGFLRSDRALIQIAGRAARNARGRVVYFADKITDAMDSSIREMSRRRKIQEEYNRIHRKIPFTATGRAVKSIFELTRDEEGVDDLSKLVLDRNCSNNLYYPKLSKGSVAAPASKPRHENRLSLYDNASKYNMERQTSHTRIDLGVEIPIPHAPALKEIIHDFPDSPGVYMWLDGTTFGESEILYIGKSVNVRRRALSYLSFSSRDSHSIRIQQMLQRAKYVRYFATECEASALLMEDQLIKRHQPKYNILLRDDASYPYIEINLDGRPLPYVKKVYNVTRKESDSCKYFGPFPDKGTLSSIIKEFDNVFNIRKLRLAAKFREIRIEEFRCELEKCLRVLQGNGNDLLCEIDNNTCERQKYSEQQIMALRDLSDYFRNDKERVDFASIVWDGELGMKGENGLKAGYPVSPDNFLLNTNGTRTCVVNITRSDSYRSFKYVEEIPIKFDGFANEVTPDIDEIFFRRLERHYMSVASMNNVPHKLVCCTPNLSPEHKVQLHSLLHSRSPGREFQITLPIDGVVNDEDDLNKMNIDDAHSHLRTIHREKETTHRRLFDLKNSLNLDRLPERIEAFDISHFHGQATVASQIVFINGKPAKHLYRLYNIECVKNDSDSEQGNINDYAAIREVIRRRMMGIYCQDENEDNQLYMPDILLIDGGKGQLNAASKGLGDAWSNTTNFTRSMNITTNVDPISESYSLYDRKLLNVPKLVALAKREEKVYCMEHDMPIKLQSQKYDDDFDNDSPALCLLRYARDEAHRFALRSSRRLRSKLVFNEKRF